MATSQSLVNEISERAIEALNYGDMHSRLSRETNIGTVKEIGLRLVQTVFISEEVAKDIDSHRTPEIFSGVFLTSDGEVQGDISLCTTDENAMLPEYRGASANSWQIFPLTGQKLLDPRNLEYSSLNDDNFQNRVGEVVSWSMARLVENPRYILTRSWNPFFDRMIAGGKGENPPTAEDELQEIGQVQTFNKSGELIKTRVHLLTQSEVRGQRQYRQIGLHPHQSDLKNVVRSSGVRNKSVSITKGGLERVRAALVRFEKEFIGGGA